MIKPANVGMLGAWISGGVEWNVFHHHRATSQYPIDYKLVDNGDGSKTIWVGEVEKRSPERVAEYREKLLARMREVLESTDIDETRIVTEAAIYADKTAVDEETVRLRSHLHQLDGMLNEVKPVGRKLDFLVQEMNREANTIGSKANDVEMAQTVVNIKSEIEKIREQIQNIE